jgi:hypothetical protein
MAYDAPKNNHVGTEGLAYTEVNKQADNVIFLKERSDNAVAHAADGTLHKTSAVVRGESATALVIETRTSDPTSPVTGQIWLRTDL